MEGGGREGAAGMGGWAGLGWLGGYGWDRYFSLTQALLYKST